MEVRKKLALSIFASFSLVSMAFAGGPETPAIDMNGVNIGAGISYKSYKYDLTQTDFTGTNVATANQAPTVDALGVAGQIGYTAAGDHWIFGILGQYEYANIHNYTDDSGVQIGGAQVNLRSRFNGMILGGIEQVMRMSLILNLVIRLLTCERFYQLEYRPGQVLEMLPVRKL